MPKKIVQEIQLFRFTELPKKAQDRAVANDIKIRMEDYDNTPEKQYGGDTIESLGFSIRSSGKRWSGIEWVEYDFVWDDYNLAWNGNYGWNPNWREDYNKSPYFGPTERPALLEFGEALEALQIKHDYKLRAQLKHHSNTYYGCDFESIVFVDEDGEEIEDEYESWDNPDFDKAMEDIHEWERSGGQKGRNWLGDMPKRWLDKTTPHPMNLDLPAFKVICKSLAYWYRKQLQDHWEGEQDEKYVAEVLADYNDKWFLVNGEEWDGEEPEDEKSN